MAIDAARTSPPATKSLNGAAQAAANALASVRAEGLDPSIAEPLLARWARGDLSDEQLDEGALRIAAGEPLSDLLGPARA